MRPLLPAPPQAMADEGPGRRGRSGWRSCALPWPPSREAEGGGGSGEEGAAAGKARSSSSAAAAAGRRGPPAPCPPPPPPPVSSHGWGTGEWDRESKRIGR